MIALEYERELIASLINREDTPGENWAALNAYRAPVQSAPTDRFIPPRRRRGLDVGPKAERKRAAGRVRMRAIRDARTTRELVEQGLVELGRGLFVTVDDRDDHCRFCSSSARQNVQMRSASDVR